MTDPSSEESSDLPSGPLLIPEHQDQKQKDRIFEKITRIGKAIDQSFPSSWYFRILLICLIWVAGTVTSTFVVLIAYQRFQLTKFFILVMVSPVIQFNTFFNLLYTYFTQKGLISMFFTGLFCIFVFKGVLKYIVSDIYRYYVCLFIAVFVISFQTLIVIDVTTPRIERLIHEINEYKNSLNPH